MRPIVILLAIMSTSNAIFAADSRDVSSRSTVVTLAVPQEDNAKTIDVVIRLTLRRACDAKCAVTYTATIVDPKDFVPDELSVRFSPTAGEIPVFISGSKIATLEHTDEQSVPGDSCVSAGIRLGYYAGQSPGTCIAK